MQRSINPPVGSCPGPKAPEEGETLSEDRQRRLAEQLQLLEAVASQVEDAVVVAELGVHFHEPRIVYVNAAFTEQTGYTAEEAIGRHPRFLVGRTSLEAQLRLRYAVEDLEPATVEVLHYRRDGSPFWVENSITPVTDESGEVTLIVSVQRDITAQKEAEEAARLVDRPNA